MSKRPWLAGVLLVGSMLIAACGSAMPASIKQSSPATAMQLVAASAVPGIRYTTKVLTMADLAKAAPVPGLQAKLVSWGYLDGRERTFQGESRHLTLVVSRALVFEGGGGALSFVGFVHSNATAFFGDGVTEQPLIAQDRSGWLLTPAACACHMASPDLIGVVRTDRMVSWLEINGPDATPALLVSLLDPADNTPV